jgi:hypothetical protein
MSTTRSLVVPFVTGASRWPASPGTASSLPTVRDPTAKRVSSAEHLNVVLTALFSTCGVSLWTFVVSAVISLPRPFSAVLVGYSLGLTAHGRKWFLPSE